MALAGPPGSGKSTLAEALREHLDTARPGIAAVLGLDGYHLDDRLLDERGWRRRKGAPHTYDVDGLAAMLARLRADDGRDVLVPVFDRSLEIARAGAAAIAGTVRLVIVEGNWLLLDEPPWPVLRMHFDVTVMLDVPRDVLATRLLQRWRELGLSDEAARHKVESNDLPNADLVMTHSAPADLTVAGANALTKLPATDPASPVRRRTAPRAAQRPLRGLGGSER